MQFMIHKNRFHETAQKITDAHTTNVQHPFVATFSYYGEEKKLIFILENNVNITDTQRITKDPSTVSFRVFFTFF